MVKNMLRKAIVAVIFSYASWLSCAQEPILYPKAERPGQTDNKKGYVVLILGSTSVGKSTVRKESLVK